MITRQDVRAALEKYIQNSNTKDFRPTGVRLAEIEPLSIEYLEKRILFENSKEIYRLEKITINLDERIKRLEDNVGFEDRVGAIVLRKTALFLGLLAALAALVTLFFKLVTL